MGFEDTFVYHYKTLGIKQIPVVKKRKKSSSNIITAWIFINSSYSLYNYTNYVLSILLQKCCSTFIKPKNRVYTLYIPFINLLLNEHILFERLVCTIFYNS